MRYIVSRRPGRAAGNWNRGDRQGRRREATRGVRRRRSVKADCRGRTRISPPSTTPEASLGSSCFPGSARRAGAQAQPADPAAARVPGFASIPGMGVGGGERPSHGIEEALERWVNSEAPAMLLRGAHEELRAVVPPEPSAPAEAIEQRERVFAQASGSEALRAPLSASEAGHNEGSTNFPADRPATARRRNRSVA